MPDMVETMFSTEVEWHRKGTLVTEALGWEQAVEMAEIDWEVEKQPQYRLVPELGPDGVTQVPEQTEQFAIVRKDTNAILGYGSEDYGIIQNREIFRFLDELADAGLKYEVAGALDGGKRVWALAQIPAGLVIDGDEIACYLAALTSHDGSHACTLLPTRIRIVCHNTWTAASSMAEKVFKIRHTKNASLAVAEAREALEVTFEATGDFAAEVETLMNQAVTPGFFDATLATLLPESEHKPTETKRVLERHRIRRIWEGSANIGRYLGTGWGLVNSWSEWEQHHRSIPVKADRDERNIRAQVDGRFGQKTQAVHEALISVR